MFYYRSLANCRAHSMFPNLFAANSEVDSYGTRTASSLIFNRTTVSEVLRNIYSKSLYSTVKVLRYNLKLSASIMTAAGSTRFPIFFLQRN